MGQIDEVNRKPRRTKGTPSYYIRNRVAAAGILAGSAIFGLWYLIPGCRILSEKVVTVLNTVSEEETDRKFIFNLVGAPRTRKSIEETIEERNQLFSER